MAYTVRQNLAHNSNYTDGREGNKVDQIIIHHAATTDFDGIARTFQRAGRGASAHYGVGQNQNVDQYMSEEDTAWHAANWPVNLRSIGIENVNLSGAPDWKIADSTFATLVELVREIATRHKLLPLVVGKNLRSHKDVSLLGTACPYALQSRLQELADAVNGSKVAASAPVAVAAPQVGGSVDQILGVGSHFVFQHDYRVDNMALINGIWQVQTSALCPRDFTWNDNGIPVNPLVEVGPGHQDQALQTGSRYRIPGTYTVLNMGLNNGIWLAEIDIQGWKLWVDVATVTEV